MRTTLTLDDDLAVLLKRASQESGKPFKEVVNDAIRAGLSGATTPGVVHLPAPRAMGQPTIDLTQALSIAAALDDGPRP